jgi:hypothetical protein
MIVSSQSYCSNRCPMACSWSPVVDDMPAIGVTPVSYQASHRPRTSPGPPLIVSSSMN